MRKKNLGKKKKKNRDVGCVYCVRVEWEKGKGTTVIASRMSRPRIKSTQRRNRG